MKKIYYHGTCTTCERIIKELGLKTKGFTFRDIKAENTTESELEEMKEKAGSYEALFSRVAIKYKALKVKPTKESEYKRYILQECTFLKRPVIFIGKEIFIGNSPKTVAAAKAAL